MRPWSWPAWLALGCEYPCTSPLNNASLSTRLVPHRKHRCLACQHPPRLHLAQCQRHLSIQRGAYQKSTSAGEPENCLSSISVFGLHPFFLLWCLRHIHPCCRLFLRGVPRDPCTGANLLNSSNLALLAELTAQHGTEAALSDFTLPNVSQSCLAISSRIQRLTH